MGMPLEKRLKRLEKAQQANTDKLIGNQQELMRREELRKLRSTPEGRRLVRRLAMESAERIGSAMRARKRAQLEAMTSPEQLERLRKQWAEEDARRAVLKAENERVEAWIESLGGHQAWIERYCTPGVQRNTGDDKAKMLDEDEGGLENGLNCKGIGPRFKWSAVQAWLESNESQAADAIPMRRGYNLNTSVSEVWE